MASRLFQWLQILVNKAYPFSAAVSPFYILIHFHTNQQIFVLTLCEVHPPPPITYSYLVFARDHPGLRVPSSLKLQFPSEPGLAWSVRSGAQ